MKKLRLILTQGLPASGKSTFAKHVIDNDPSYVALSRDDIRLMLCGRKGYKKFKPWRESIVTEVIHSAAVAAFYNEKNVIVHDCNLKPSIVENWQEIAKLNGVDCEINNSFLHVPYGVCIERDQKREFPVQQKVIEGMYKKYKSLYWPEPIFDRHKNNCVIFDLDGTLCEMGNRSPYDATKCREDGLHLHTAHLLDSVRAHDPETVIVFCSGREDLHEDATRGWIKDALGMVDQEYELFMRDAGDSRKDYTIKEGIYWNDINPFYNVLYAIDDRNQVVHMWRSLGIPCLQVNYGYF